MKPTATAATIRPLRLETGGGSGLVQGKAPGGVRKKNYARAYKRIQIIITFLHGEQPENVNLTTAEETADAASTTAE